MIETESCWFICRISKRHIAYVPLLFDVILYFVLEQIC